jgi:trehalose-6-phosphate synthase
VGERHERIEGIRSQVREHDVDRWMQDQLDDLAEVHGVSAPEALR